MKAILHTQYGPPEHLQFAEVEKPALPQNDEVLIKVYASSVNAAEWRIIRGTPFLVRLMMGLFKPSHKIPGADIAGRVEAVGPNITQFKVGDEVFADMSGSFGAYAEYVCSHVDRLVLKPKNMTFEQAASVPLAGVTALQGLRDKGHIQAGQKVLINGASGGVGTFAVQIAKAFGADVTAVCSTRKMEMVRSIGADRVIDHTKEDITKQSQKYDLILDVGAYRPFTEYRRILTPKGIYVLAGGSITEIFRTMFLSSLMSKAYGQTFTNLMAGPNKTDLATLRDLMEAGKVTPVIDRCYPLNEVPQALRYVEDGHVQGKVVITIAENSKP